MKKTSTAGGVNNAARVAAMKQRQLQNDIKKAKTTNTQTLGGAAKKAESKKKDETKRTEQKESVVLRSVDTDESKQLKDEQPRVEQKDVPQQEAPQAKVEDTPARPEPKKSDESLANFMDVMSSSTSKDEMSTIMTNSTLEMTAKGKINDPEMAPAFAARSALRYSVDQINKLMPGASQAEIREAAKTNPELAKWTKVADSAGGYIQDLKKEKTEAAAAEAGAPGASAQNGAASQVAGAADVPVDGPEQPQVGDPFAQAKGMSASGGGGESGGIGTENYKLDPEQQAQMMADNMKTMEAIRNIYAQMWADMRKAQAERHQIMMETSRSISDMVMKSFMNRQASAQAHTNAFLSYITESA